jgi:hypothetical protein
VLQPAIQFFGFAGFLLASVLPPLALALLCRRSGVGWRHIWNQANLGHPKIGGKETGDNGAKFASKIDKVTTSGGFKH